MKKNEEKGFVYLLGDWEKDGIYKIGVTKGTIERRIKKLQTGNSGEIFMCDYYKTEHPFFIERQLHLKYQSKKVSGEWYQLTNEEALDFKNVCRSVENLIEIMKDNPFFPKKLN